MTPRVETHIRLGIRSISLSDQSPRCPHEETFGPYLFIVKCRAVCPRNLAECFREVSRRKPSAKKVIFVFLREKGALYWTELYIKVQA